MNKDYYNKQLKRFVEITKLLDYEFKMIHMSNSSSMIKYEDDIDRDSLHILNNQYAQFIYRMASIYYAG